MQVLNSFVLFCAGGNLAHCNVRCRVFCREIPRNSYKDWSDTLIIILTDTLTTSLFLSCDVYLVMQL